jgi:hypothetical protein
LIKKKVVKIDDTYWLKFGEKEDGKFVCIRQLSKAKPAKEFYYNHEGKVKGVKNPRVIMLSRDMLIKLDEVAGNENSNKR